MKHPELTLEEQAELEAWEREAHAEWLRQQAFNAAMEREERYNPCWSINDLYFGEDE